MTVFAEYVREIRKNLERGDSTEYTHRPALKILLEACGKDIVATNEPRRIVCGAPDFNITRKGVPLGHVEAKDVGANLDEMERGKGPNGEQFTRYRDALPNWILTDYLQFRWFVNREKRLTVRVAELDVKGKVKPLPDGEEKLTQLRTAFFEQEALTVGTAKELAERMAGMTRIIRDLIVKAFEHEKEQGWLHNWLAAFRETLIPEVDEKQFADMFAQTLAYGLFAACVHTPANKEFSREMAAYNLPKTNPFLRKLFAEIGGVDMPDSIAWAVNDIVELLKHADMYEILKDFGKGKEDPVVHFYETFLAAYDLKMREVRGVYYTPEPVVSYIVRSIDHLLQTRFNRPQGLADEKTLILDPATGTATFLYFVINEIHQKFAKQAGAWDGYVAKHLLNRIFGFELLMAPYAIAHLKLGMQLQETGYQFDSDQRLGVYLTNTLEEAAKKSEQLFAGWVAEEANEAAEIKRDKEIMVVLGNPPYSGHSANRSRDDQGNRTFIGDLIEDYKQVDGHPLGERNPKWLQDDYVKFIRFAEWRIEKTGEGVHGFITNHGYLDNPTFRGMRQHLIQTFDEIYVLDLHGNSKKKERAPDGGKDENVFDIQQGVAILLAIKLKRRTGKPKAPARVFHAELWGRREIHEVEQLIGGKYHWLWQNTSGTTPWKELSPSTPFYLFRPQDTELIEEYEKGWSMTEAMPVNTVGIVTGQDAATIAFTGPEAIMLATRHGLSPQVVHPLLYRPFDIRHLVYDKKVVTRSRQDVMRHMIRGQNIALIATRQTRDGWHVFATDCLMGHKSMAAFDINTLFPLYLYPNGELPDGLFAHDNGRVPNLSTRFIKVVLAKLGVQFITDRRGNLRKTVGPEDIFHYAYAVFYSPTYRSRYAEFLKIDFPRLPLTSDVKMFRALAAKGAELVALHLLESPKLEDFLTDWPVKGDNVVEKVQYTDNDKRVWINKTQYFGGVPKAVWEFHIGGYQVCQKWLKDRKGRKLTYEDTQHYQKIVVALNETIRLMQDIDEVIRQHGDWPTAFLGGNT